MTQKELDILVNKYYELVKRLIYEYVHIDTIDSSVINIDTLNEELAKNKLTEEEFWNDFNAVRYLFSLKNIIANRAHPAKGGGLSMTPNSKFM